jgi:oligopeptide transport system permease protein
MGRYVVRRLLQAIPVLLGTTFLIFAIVYALPGDPLQALAGEKRVDPVFAAALRAQFHLNEPLIVRYGYYLRDIVSGNFGTTFRGLPVSTIFEAVIGLGLGLWAALRRGRWEDKAILAVTLLMVSVPTLVSGFVLQLVLGVKLKLATGVDFFPVAGVQDGMRSYFLPGFVLAMLSIAYLTRLTRTSLMETLRADYVRTALAKGMPRRRVLGRHALRNSLIPMVTYLGADLGTLMGGAVITESIFNLPGIGQQLFQSVYLRENSVVVGIVTVLVLVYIVANLIIDLLYAVLDPRIRYE